MSMQGAVDAGGDPLGGCGAFKIRRSTAVPLMGERMQGMIRHASPFFLSWLALAVSLWIQSVTVL